MCRALLSVMDEHNVDSFISLSSPQMGQYGGEWALWAVEANMSGAQRFEAPWHCCSLLLRHGLFEVAVPYVHAV